MWWDDRSAINYGSISYNGEEVQKDTILHVHGLRNRPAVCRELGACPNPVRRFLFLETLRWLWALTVDTPTYPRSPIPNFSDDLFIHELHPVKEPGYENILSDVSVCSLSVDRDFSLHSLSFFSDPMSPSFHIWQIFYNASVAAIGMMVWRRTLLPSYRHSIVLTRLVLRSKAATFG